MAFYINYPIGGYYGCGYYLNVDDGTMEKITYDIYDHDIKEWSTSYMIKNATDGTVMQIKTKNIQLSKKPLKTI